MGLNNTINENMLYNKNNGKNNLIMLKMLKLDINDNVITYHKYLNIKPVLYFIFTLFLFLSYANAQENGTSAIAFITEIKGDVQKDLEDSKVPLRLYDQIFVNEKIEIGANSSATVLFNDNTILTLKAESAFEVLQYDKLSLKQKFVISIPKGTFVVESGSIAKSNGGRMTLKLPKSEIDLKGTRVGGGVSADGQKESVYLAEDSFGNVGQIVIMQETGDIQQISNVNEGIVMEEGKESLVESLEQDSQLEIFSEFKEAVINSTKVDEKSIAKEMTKRLAEGTMIDQNGDGKIDLADVGVISDSVKDEFSARLDYVIDSSTEADTSLIADVMDASDASFVESIMETIVNDNPEMVVGLVENLVEHDNAVIFSGDNAELQEKIFESVMQNDSGNNFETLTSIMSQGNEQVSGLIMSQIMEADMVADPTTMDPLEQTTGPEDMQSNVALMVLSQLSEINPDKLAEIATTDQEQFSDFTSQAIGQASVDDTKYITDFLSNTIEDIGEMIFHELSLDTMEDNMLVAAVFDEMVQENWVGYLRLEFFFHKISRE